MTEAKADGQAYARYEGYIGVWIFILLRVAKGHSSDSRIKLTLRLTSASRFFTAESKPGVYFGIVLQWRSKNGKQELVVARVAPITPHAQISIPLCNIRRSHKDMEAGRRPGGVLLLRRSAVALHEIWQVV